MISDQFGGEKKRYTKKEDPSLYVLFTTHFSYNLGLDVSLFPFQTDNLVFQTYFVTAVSVFSDYSHNTVFFV